MKQNDLDVLISKVPQVTLLFWITKIFATTFGETAGDAVSMSLNLGYLVGTFIFAFIFIAFVYFQIRAKAFHPYFILVYHYCKYDSGDDTGRLC